VSRCCRPVSSRSVRPLGERCTTAWLAWSGTASTAYALVVVGRDRHRPDKMTGGEFTEALLGKGIPAKGPRPDGASHRRSCPRSLTSTCWSRRSAGPHRLTPSRGACSPSRPMTTRRHLAPCADWA
jgi:hypothetical protein